MNGSLCDGCSVLSEVGVRPRAVCVCGRGRGAFLRGTHSTWYSLVGSAACEMLENTVHRAPAASAGVVKMVVVCWLVMKNEPL